MPSFKAAHVREQGVDLIIVPLDPSFGQLSVDEQCELIDRMQQAANSAGLAGTVVPVWRIGARTAFVAPRNWHPFFQSVTWDDVLANVNNMISW
jgi:hypothetical protein